MYLAPHDLLVMTAAGLSPHQLPRGVPAHLRPGEVAVRPSPRRRRAALRRLLARMLLHGGLRLLRSARHAEARAAAAVPAGALR